MEEPPDSYTLRADTRHLLKIIVAALEDKKAEDMKILVVGAVSSLADIFVVCTGTSNRHAQALIEYVIEQTKAQGLQPFGTEGKDTGWSLVDYSDIVVHIFDQETRDYYDIEKLWLDAPRLDPDQLDLPLAS